MELVYQNDQQSVKVAHDISLNIVVIRFTGHVDHESYQAAYTKFLEVALHHQSKKLLYDILKLKKLSVKSRIWYLKKVAPELLIPNVRSAIVDAENLGNQVATETMTEALIEMGFSPTMVKRFDAYEEAWSWLEQEPE